MRIKKLADYMDDFFEYVSVGKMAAKMQELKIKIQTLVEIQRGWETILHSVMPEEQAKAIAAATKPVDIQGKKLFIETKNADEGFLIYLYQQAITDSIQKQKGKYKYPKSAGRLSEINVTMRR